MNYTFKIYALNIVDEFVNPDNAEQLNIIPFRTEGQKFIRNKINTNIVLSGSDYILVYNLLKDNPCTQFKFIITRKDQTTPIFTGLFTYYNIGTINEDKCTFDFGMITDDIYTSFMNKWKDEHNILNTNQIIDGVSEITNPVTECQMDTVYETETIIKQYRCYFFGNWASWADIPLTAVDVWDVSLLDSMFGVPFDDFKIKSVLSEKVSNTYIPPSPPYIVLQFGNSGAEQSWIFTVQYHREVLRYPEINGTWQTPPVVVPVWTFRYYQIIAGNNNKVYSRLYSYASHYVYDYQGTDHYIATIDLVPDTSITFVNCRRLRAVIDYMLLEIGFNNMHLSDFFYDVEPNPVTNESGHKLKYLLIGQKSDFIPPIGANPATKQLWTLENCLNMLRDIFNVYWYFDGWKLRLEHETFFEKGLSYGTENVIVISVDSRYLIETNKFNIDFSKYLGYEKFDYSEQDGVDFIGVPIRYGDCLPDKNSETSRTVVDVTTDIVAVYNQLVTVSEDNMMLLQTKYIASNDPQYLIENESGILAPSKTYTNGHLAWAMLQEKYWKPGVRILPNFNMNGVDYSHVGLTEKVKIQTELSIPFCGYALNFYPLLKINDLPEAKMLDASFSLKTEQLTLKLAYDV